MTAEHGDRLHCIVFGGVPFVRDARRARLALELAANPRARLVLHAPAGLQHLRGELGHRVSRYVGGFDDHQPDEVRLMPLRESRCDVDPRAAFGRVVKDDEDVLVCHDSNPSH